MDLAILVPYLSPSARSVQDYTIGLVNGAQIITYWNTTKLGQQPTLTQLEAAWPAAQLQAAQTAQRALINASCIAAMTGGFQSSALGAPYTYPSTLTDQHNLSGSVVASLLPNLPSTWTTPFWCKNSSGVWAMVEHTAAQIQQVGIDGKAWITTCQQQKASLDARINAATTVSAVQSVLWS